MGARGPIASSKVTVKFTPGVPEPSQRLDEPAREEYRRVVEICRECGRELQQPDMAILEVYCQSFSDYWRHDALIREEGEVLTANNGIMMKNQRTGLRETAWKQLIAAAAKLGFSPADRARLNSGGEKNGKANPLDQFIGA